MTAGPAEALMAIDMDEMTNIEKPVIRAIDLCAGAGGWACAARGLPIHITHAFDFAPDCCETYRLNHPGTEVVCGDLLDSGASDRVKALAGQVDLVLGGIPCESISVYRNGWNGLRPSDAEMAGFRRLLDAVLAIVRRLDPRWWCLEDVVGLANEVPPMTPHVILDAGHWSGQTRKRLFVGRFPLPASAGCKKVLRNYLQPGPYRIGPRLHGRTPVSSSAFTAGCCRAVYPAKKAPTIAGWIASRRDAECAIMDEQVPGGKRQLEWQEAALAQGFPADYLFYGSPTRVAKMIGQAIQIDLGRAILAAISAESEKEKGLAHTHA